MSDDGSVVWFDGCVSAGNDVVGGKAVGLGRLHDLDLPVPPGFAVTTAAYRGWLDRTGTRERLADLTAPVTTDTAVGELQSVAASVEALFEQTPVDDDLASSVLEAYARLGEPPVAVRSSATAEDTADASFAGQQESYLWVDGGAALLAALSRCWASLFTPQAMAYRASMGVDVADLAMGVVVQQMVEASTAGVMMTLDPVSGDRSQITVEACLGLGVGVVGGELTPDRYTVDKVTLEVRTRTVVPKDRRFVRGGDGVALEDVPDEERDAAALSDGELKRLADVGKRAERSLGAAQDVEWAFGPGEVDARELFLLQTRPETVWSRRGTSSVTKPGATLMDRVLDTLARGPSTG